MNALVVRKGASGRRLIGAIPAGLGAIAISWMELGPIATLFVAGLALLGLVVTIRLYPFIYRWRHRLEAGEEGYLLVAESSLDGRPGSLRIYEDRLTWSAVRGSATLRALDSDIAEIRISAPRVLRATRMIVILRDGDQFGLTITAGIDRVASALDSSTTTSR
jgi:hypothetical protein